MPVAFMVFTAVTAILAMMPYCLPVVMIWQQKPIIFNIAATIAPSR